MFLPQYAQIKPMTERGIKYGITLSENAPGNKKMCCQMIHDATKTVVCEAFGVDDQEAFEEAFKLIPSGPIGATANTVDALSAENAALKAQLEAALKPKSGKTKELQPS